MPTDERGDKWACESCVRGHRARTCDHYDRWMIMVKKPGRPLQECPHPRSNCNCRTRKARAMMVKIRKDGQCLCQPKSIEEMAPHTAQGNVYPMPPPVSHQAAHPPFVEGHLPPTSPHIKQNNGIPDLFPQDLQGLQAISSSAYTVPMHAFSGPSQFVHAQSNGQHQLHPLFAAQAQMPPNPMNQQHPLLTHAQQPQPRQQWPVPAEQQRSCCSPENPSPALSQLENSQLENASSTSVTPPESSSKHEERRESESHGLPRAKGQSSRPIPRNTQWENQSPSIEHEKALEQQTYYPKSPETTIYHIPSSVATSENPVTIESQAELQRNNVYSQQTIPVNAMSGITGVAAPSAEASCMGSSCSTAPHACNCGDMCRCAGCPVHPHNPTMQAKMQEMVRHLELEPGSNGASRPQSSYGGVMNPSDHLQMSPMTPNFPIGQEFEWLMAHPLHVGQHDHLPPAIDHNDFHASGAAFDTFNAFANQPLSSPDYMHFQFEVPECPAPLELNCHCFEGCGCTGCLAHTGHLEDEFGQNVGI